MRLFLCITAITIIPLLALLHFTTAEVSTFPSKADDTKVLESNTEQKTFDESKHHHNIRSCLQDKRIVFVGDSLTRYQYLNLVNFLATGHWTSAKPSMTWEKGNTFS